MSAKTVGWSCICPKADTVPKFVKIWHLQEFQITLFYVYVCQGSIHFEMSYASFISSIPLFLNLVKSLTSMALETLLFTFKMHDQI